MAWGAPRLCQRRQFLARPSGTRACAPRPHPARPLPGPGLRGSSNCGGGRPLQGRSAVCKRGSASCTPSGGSALSGSAPAPRGTPSPRGARARPLAAAKSRAARVSQQLPAPRPHGRDPASRLGALWLGPGCSEQAGSSMELRPSAPKSGVKGPMLSASPGWHGSNPQGCIPTWGPGFQEASPQTFPSQPVEGPGHRGRRWSARLPCSRLVVLSRLSRPTPPKWMRLGGSQPWWPGEGSWGTRGKKGESGSCFRAGRRGPWFPP